MNIRGHLISVAAAAGVCLLSSTPAAATPGSKFGPPILVVNGHFGQIDVKTESAKTDHWGMIAKTKDDTDVGSDKLVIQPGGYSGWHSHPAPVFVTVTAGSIVWVDGSNPVCPAHTYNQGESFIERAYTIHDVRNASDSEGAEYIAIRMNPTGVGFRIDEDEPTNC
jgi:quercetin dioxygenase-like cupin family protein